MPEFGVGSVVLPNLPPSIDELKAKVEAFRAANREREAKIDQAFIDAAKSLTGIDLTDAVEAGRRSESLGGGQIGPESLLIDQLLTAPTSSSADLPAGVDERGRQRVMNQNKQTSYTIGADGKLNEVEMLPMWLADP